MIHDYDEAIAYLEHLVATPVCNEPGAGLARARLMLSHVGDPQERFATLHVTGSSGKGSTAAMAAAILRAAAYRTGIFSSDFRTTERENGRWQLFGGAHGAPKLGFIKLRHARRRVIARNILRSHISANLPARSRRHKMPCFSNHYCRRYQ